MNLQIGEPSSPSFQQPLALLSDCHRRVERFLGLLVRVASEARNGRLDEREREALDIALRYFREASPLHTADEEASLFPRLRALQSSSVQEILTQLQDLERDHSEATPHHRAVDELGTRWLQAGVLSEENRVELVLHLEKLAGIYPAHIRMEDELVFPTAGNLLDAASLAEVGREMAARRGQPFVPAGFETSGWRGEPASTHAPN